MKKQIFSLFIFFCLSKILYAATCTSGTYVTPTGSINDGFIPTVKTIGSPTLSGFIGGPWRPGAGATFGMRVQYLFKATELISAGLVAGPITSIAWNVTAAGGAAVIPNFTIRIDTTPFPFLINAYDPVNNVVYGPQSVNSPITTGVVTYNFITPFNWNGTANIEIEVCHDPTGLVLASPSIDEAITSFVGTNQRTTTAGCGQVNGTTRTNRPIARFGQNANYDNNLNCTYLISPGAGYNSITLNFTDFITQLNSDGVEIYDGAIVDPLKLIAVYSGNLNSNLPSVTSLTNQMLVRFITDGSITATGWAANYVSNVQCGGTTVLTASSGAFNDGSGALYYYNNQDCSWLISPGSAFNNISLDFTNFCTESGITPFDYVKIYDGPNASSNLITTLSGSLGTVPTITSTGNQLFVVFHSDGSNTNGPCYDGWDASYQSHYCSVIPTVMTGISGSFCDNSPLNYLNNTNCSWQINPSPPINANQTIGLTFSGFKTEAGFDVVSVYNGTSANTTNLVSGGQVSGAPVIPFTLHSQANTPSGQLFVQFISDNSANDSGFCASWIVNNTPSVTISGNTPVCEGGTISLSVTQINGGLNPVFQWRVNGINAGTNSNQFSSGTLNNGDSVSCSMTSTDPSAWPVIVTTTVAVVVNPLPAVGATASLNDSVCNGASVTLNGTGALTYVWDHSVIDGVSFVPPPSTTTTYHVTGTDVNSCSNTSSINITSAPLPAPVIISNTGSFNLCPHNNITLDAGAGFSSYHWSTAATTQTISVTNAGTYTVTVSNLGTCFNSSSVTIISSPATPAKPGTITGPVDGMCNSSGTYYVAPVTNATSYLWTVTNGSVTSGQGTTTVTISFGTFTTSTISVKSVNGCGQSSARTLNVNSIPLEPVSVIGQISGVCKMNGLIYSTTAVTGATSYNWTVPTGVSIASGQGTTSITVNFLSQFVSGNICVKSVNSCGSSSLQTCISVSAIPTAPLVINGPSTVCVNQVGVIYSTSPIIGTTNYHWTVPYHAIIVSGQGTTSIVVNYSHYFGRVEVWARNSCGSSTDFDLPIHFNCREEDESILTTNDNDINAYPNPVNENLNLKIFSELNKKCTIRLIDLPGKQLLYDSFELISGDNLRQYPMNGIAKGLYLVIIEREGLASVTIRIAVD